MDIQGKPFIFSLKSQKTRISKKYLGKKTAKKKTLKKTTK